MSLSKSFTERRRSYQHLGHSLSADQASLRQHLPPAGEPAATGVQPPLQPAAAGKAVQQQIQDAEQGPAAAAAAGAAAGVGGEQAPPPPSAEPSGRASASHWEWNSLLEVGASPDEPGGVGQAAPAETAADAGAAQERPTGVPAPAKPLGALRMLQSAASGRLEAIARLQEAPMPPALAAAGLDAALEANVEAAAAAEAAAIAAQAAGGEAGPAAAGGAADAPAPSSRTSMLLSTSLGPLGALMSSVASQLPSSSASGGPSAQPQPPAGQAAPARLPGKQPGKLLQLLGKLRSEPAPGHVPLTTGRVELSGRALLPGGADGMRVAIFDDEPTSVVAYFLATK